MPTEQNIQQLLTEVTEAVKKALHEATAKGVNANDRTRALHAWIAKLVQKTLGTEYKVQSMQDPKPAKTKNRPLNEEAVLEGAYHGKKVDIAVFKKENPAMCIAVKVFLYGYKKNANNYFEQMQGETANLQMENIPTIHFICMTYPTAKKDGKKYKLERIDNLQIEKYRRMMAYQENQEKRFQHIPIVICILIFAFEPDEESNPELQNPKNHEITGLATLAEMDLSYENRNFLENEASLDNFLKTVKMIAEGEPPETTS